MSKQNASYDLTETVPKLQNLHLIWVTAIPKLAETKKFVSFLAETITEIDIRSGSTYLDYYDS